MTYLKFLNENFGQQDVEEDPVYINTSKRKTQGNIGVVDDEDPKYKNHMQFLKNTLETSQLKVFLREYLASKNSKSMELERTLQNLFRRFWNNKYTYEEFNVVLNKKKLPLKKTNTMGIDKITKHAQPFFDQRFFDDLFSVTAGKKGTSVGDGEIILWFLFANLLNPTGKGGGDITTTNGQGFEIKKAFGSTGFRFVSQIQPVKWDQLEKELIDLGDIYKLKLPLLAAARTKSFTRDKFSELRQELVNNKNDELYRKVITLFHPYRQFSDNDMGKKLNIFKSAINGSETFEEFLVACQFYSYANLEKFAAIGFWMSRESLTIIGGNDLESFEGVHGVVQKYLKAHALWDNSRGPGQVRTK